MSYIYSSSISIIDKEKFGLISPESNYLLTFNPNIPEKSKKEVSNIFAKSSTYESISDWREYKYDKKTNTVLLYNVCLPKTTSIKRFKLIMAFIFGVHITCLDFKVESISITLSNPSYNDFFEENTIIGDAKFTIVITNRSQLRENGYEIEFHKEYDRDVKFLNELGEVPPNPNPFIYSFSIIAIPKKTALVNVVKLFNLIHTTDGVASRVYVSSLRLKEFLQTNHLYHYIRSRKGSINVESSIVSRVNSFAAVINDEINEHIRLYEFVLMENGCIELIFTNNDPSVSLSNLIEISTNWLSEHFENITDKLMIEEAIYDDEYKAKLSNYRLVNGLFSSYITVDRIGEMSSLSKLEIYEVIYKTKSTIRYSLKMSLTDSTIERYNYIDNGSYKYISASSLYALVASSLLIIEDNGKTGLWFYNVDESNMKLLYSLVIGNMTSRVEIDKTSPQTLMEKLDRERNNRDSRLELQLLSQTDPVLFSSRTTVKNGGEIQLEYSQFIQRIPQRPTVITLNDFEKLVHEFPNSVANLRNQSNGNRLYLACPSKDYPIINYHHFTNQMCIVRCTRKQSNLIQMQHCATSLGVSGTELMAKGRLEAPISFDSTMRNAVLYLPPIELAEVLPTCVCIKSEISNEDELRKWMNIEFNLSSFIIERDNIDKVYRIRSEYDKEKTFGLIIFEKDKGYFIVRDVTTSYPYVVNFGEKDNQFIRSITHISNVNPFVNRFILYINAITSRQYSIEDKVSTVLHSIENDTKSKFVSNARDEIVGVMLGGKELYLTPRIFNPGIETIPILDVITNVDNLPRYSSMDQSKISKYYFAYPSHRVIMVKYNGFSTFVRPFKSNVKGRLIDFLAYTMYLVGDEITRIPGNGRSKNINSGINDVYLSYMMVNEMKGKSSIDKILTKDETSIVYLDKEETIASWRKSRINKSDFDKFIKNINTTDTIHRIQIINEKLSRDMDFTFVQGEQINRDLSTK